MMPRPVESDPQINAESAELSSIVDQAIGKLRVDDRRAIILKFLAGKSIEQVGAELRLSPERLTGEIADFLDECWKPRRKGGRSKRPRNVA